MGVHDYTCSVCGTPASYECDEASGGECKQTGIGESSAILDLCFFAAADGPARPDAFEAALPRVRRVETRAWEYDWGAWEWEPPLNYREVLVDRADDLGIWPVRPPTSDFDTSPCTLEIPPGEVVWAVNYCRECRRMFVDGDPPAASERCRRSFEAVCRQLGLAWSPELGKEALAGQIRARVARRRPAG